MNAVPLQRCVKRTCKCKRIQSLGVTPVKTDLNPIFLRTEHTVKARYEDLFFSVLRNMKDTVLVNKTTCARLADVDQLLSPTQLAMV